MPRVVIQFLVPLITHSSPSRRAFVIMPPGSEPASGSDSAKAGDHSPLAQRGRKRCLSWSEPNRRIGSVPSSCTMRISAVEAQALATSSIAMLSISVPVPVPPYSASKGRPRRSCSANSRRRSHGYSALASISAARGSTRSRTIWRIVSRKATWSSERAELGSGGVLVAIRRRLEHLSAGVFASRGSGHASGAPSRGEPPVGIGTSIFLIAIGAILYFAVNADVSGLEISTVGLILMIVGIIGLLISLFYTTLATRRRGPVDYPADRPVA